MSELYFQDTIVAIATASGAGGIGIVRLSGKGSLAIANAICSSQLAARHAHYCRFTASDGQALDQGIALYFPGPASFTGEDVVELQGHGGQVVLDMLLQDCLQRGARMARPGEFSERAYLNNKIDLVQAEAIADLIGSGSEQAARGALKSLHGEFSRRLDDIASQMMRLRIYVEAALDFPEEEIDFLEDQAVQQGLEQLTETLHHTLQQSRQGALLREGISVAIVGRPNAGKSSLLNALSGSDTAIVTDIAGTTRDVISQDINLDGLLLHLLDTAGLRDAEDAIEREGIRRALSALQQADLILLVSDASRESSVDLNRLWQDLLPDNGDADDLRADLLQASLLIKSKVDLLDQQAGDASDAVYLSVHSGQGLDDLRQQIKQRVGYASDQAGAFSARRRHVQALQQATDLVAHGQQQLKSLGAGELLAEDLKQAQHCLAEITGQVSSDDLLGEIFSSFCIGK